MSTPNRRQRRSVLLTAIIAAVVLATTACNDSLTSIDLPQDVTHDTRSTSLSQTIQHLAVRAATLEDNRDVKCWTSLKLLETFIAGIPLAPESTYAKTEVTKNYLDQIWAKADQAARTSVIGGEAFRRVTQQVVPSRTDSLLDYTVTFPDRDVQVRYHDVDNYHQTVEPIRLLQTLAKEVQRNNPQRKGLSPQAVNEATQVAALLCTLVLREANIVATELQHAQISGADVFEADRRIARALQLRQLDPIHRKHPSHISNKALQRNTHSMLSVARQKIHSLRRFNTDYSRDQLAQEFGTSLVDHEKEWAQLPVDAQASAAYKETDLVDLAEFLYESCARLHPHHEPLTGAQMMSTIQRSYPSITHFEHGTIHLYPNQPQILGLKVEEYEADAFRDSTWHWRAIERMLQRTADRQLPSMDLYALEELSEFISVFGVAYVKLAGQIARDHPNGKVSLLDRRAFKSARRMIVRASEDHSKTLAGAQRDSTKNEVESIHGNRHEDGYRHRRDSKGNATAWKSLKTAYIEAVFTDVTSTSGIDFRHESSPFIQKHRFDTQGTRPQYIPGYVTRARHLREQGYESSIPNHSLGIEGGGVAVADIDDDGFLDIYFVSGQSDRLFRNLGNLRFEDVTDRAIPSDNASHSLAGHDATEQTVAEGRGAYFVDYDNDGDQDLFITQVYAPFRLLQNQGDGTFRDVTKECGLPLRKDLVSHSATWFDFDNDGWIDVYIGNYGDWLGDDLPSVQANSRNGQPNLLYRNDGHGGFEDISLRAGAGDVGWAQAVSHFDVNRDGWQDLYIANDFGQDLILVNDNGARFISEVVAQGRFLHGMSVGFTDVNRDGAEDIYVSNISTFSFASKHIKPSADTRIAVSQRTTQDMRMMENNLFMVSGSNGYREQHHSYFDRSHDGSGWAWDADFFDFDNDGEEDLYIVNGREPNLSYAFERNVLYKQVEGHFYDVSANSGADFKSNARGAVHVDLDNDGDLDIVVNNYQDNAVILRNNLQRHNWIRLRLQGSVSNRDAIGARVKIQTENGKQLRTVRGGGGFLSKEDTAVHFGLKDERAVGKIEVLWPSGRKQVFSNLPINREHTIIEISDEDSD